MKWKLYLLCSYYNILISLGCACLFIYFFVQARSLRDILSYIFLMAILALVLLKNLVGIQFYRNTKEKQSHRDRFGLFFYFLWFVNIICFAIYAFLMYDLLKTLRMEGWKGNSVIEICLAVSAFIAVPTLLYTICLDIPLERKARKLYDIAEGLLQSDNETV